MNCFVELCDLGAIITKKRQVRPQEWGQSTSSCEGPSKLVTTVNMLSELMARDTREGIFQFEPLNLIPRINYLKKNKNKYKRTVTQMYYFPFIFSLIPSFTTNHSELSITYLFTIPSSILIVHGLYVAQAMNPTWRPEWKPSAGIFSSSEENHGESLTAGF